MSDTPRVVAWFKHGPYSSGEKEVCVVDDPHDDDCYSPLVFLSDYEELKRDLAAVTAERDAHDRWLREMCEDYRLSADDSAQSRRAAINTLIHDVRGERDALREKMDKVNEFIEGLISTGEIVEMVRGHE